MASKSVAVVTLLSLNLLFFSVVSSNTIAPTPNPLTPPPPPLECPELGVCLDILRFGSPEPNCCSLLGGVVEVGAIVCICDEIKLNVLGIPINIALNLMLNVCGLRNGTNYVCN